MILNKACEGTHPNFELEFISFMLDNIKNMKLDSPWKFMLSSTQQTSTDIVFDIFLFFSKNIEILHAYLEIAWP